MIDLDTSVKYLKTMEFDMKYEIFVTQIRSVTMRNLGQLARRKGGKEGKGARKLNEKEEDLFECSYFHICILKQMHTLYTTSFVP